MYMTILMCLLLIIYVASHKSQGCVGEVPQKRHTTWKRKLSEPFDLCSPIAADQGTVYRAGARQGEGQQVPRWSLGSGHVLVRRGGLRFDLLFLFFCLHASEACGMLRQPRSYMVCQLHV